MVTLETPRTSADLRELARGSIPFALMFAMVCWIWWEHNKFFRRYDLQDAWTAFLNATLLFVVLFGTFVLRYRHAWSQRQELGLSPAEEVSLRYGQRAHVLTIALGLLSITIARAA